jgi:rare lipoprotein A (peptidoglycan hydrolase)
MNKLKTYFAFFVLICTILYVQGFKINEIPELPGSVPQPQRTQKIEKVLEIPIEEGVSYGIASYYGDRWNGRTTANMEIYNSRPLEPHPKRILDLSKATFASIGDLSKGLLNIKYKLLGDERKALLTN